MTYRLLIILLCLIAFTGAAESQKKSSKKGKSAAQAPKDSASARAPARSFGMKLGTLQPGKLNAITDVLDVRVGHATVIDGESARTGVTAIFPHGRNLYAEKVPAAISVTNGAGKVVGAMEVSERGVIETPIILTSTLSVWTAADAVAGYMLGLPANKNVTSVNPLVAETNDGILNDLRGKHVTKEHVLAALRAAKKGEVAQGAIGAGTGTVCYGWKGGIGTSSRKLPADLGGYTVGVLVQANGDGSLEMLRAPIGELLGVSRTKKKDNSDGGFVVVIATDAPLAASDLSRLAQRVPLALRITGSPADHAGSDCVIAFSLNEAARPRLDLQKSSGEIDAGEPLSEEHFTLLFQAVTEATEEAVYNALFFAETMTGKGVTVEALPLAKAREQLKKQGRIQ